MPEVARNGGAVGDVAVKTGTENHNRPTGNGTLVAHADVDGLFGGDGDDTAKGNRGNDTIFGNNGDDSLEDGSDELTAMDLVWL